MRRFSQRNSLVTLSDINITPLLDLAFVLLIIFVITTPLLEKGLPLALPSGGGKPDVNLQKKAIRTLDVMPQGAFRLESKVMRPEQIIERLKADFAANPNLIVYIRADKNGRIDLLAKAMTFCDEAGISRLSFRFEPLQP